jgi:hypothetical protein
MIPSDTLCPSAPALTVKSDSGSFPLPRVWNGPPKLSVIGPLSVEDPPGSIVRLRSSLPLETLCEPLKVWPSSVLGLSEPPLEALPQAATMTDATSIRSVMSAVRR